MGDIQMYYIIIPLQTLKDGSLYA